MDCRTPRGAADGEGQENAPLVVEFNDFGINDGEGQYSVKRGFSGDTFVAVYNEFGRDYTCFGTQVQFGYISEGGLLARGPVVTVSNRLIRPQYFNIVEGLGLVTGVSPYDGSVTVWDLKTGVHRRKSTLLVQKASRGSSRSGRRRKRRMCNVESLEAGIGFCVHSKSGRKIAFRNGSGNSRFFKAEMKATMSITKNASFA